MPLPSCVRRNGRHHFFSATTIDCRIRVVLSKKPEGVADLDLIEALKEVGFKWLMNVRQWDADRGVRGALDDKIFRAKLKAAAASLTFRVPGRAEPVSLAEFKTHLAEFNADEIDDDLDSLPVGPATATPPRQAEGSSSRASPATSGSKRARTS